MKIKKYISLLPILAMVLLAATSCAKEEDFGGFLNSPMLGIITEVSDGDEYYFKMRTDAGSTFIATEVVTGSQKVEEGQRVSCAYKIIGPAPDESGTAAYYVKIYGFYDLLTKPIIKESFIKENYEHRDDSIGNDLISIFELWFGGNCANISFDYIMESGSSQKHMINLVWADEEEGAEPLWTKSEGAPAENDGIRTVHLYLRHNAYGENQGINLKTNRGFVSFPIREIVPEGEESVEIVIHYNWNGRTVGEYYTEKLPFTPDKYSYIYAGPPAIGSDIMYLPERTPIFMK